MVMKIDNFNVKNLGLLTVDSHPSVDGAFALLTATGDVELFSGGKLINLSQVQTSSIGNAYFQEPVESIENTPPGHSLGKRYIVGVTPTLDFDTHAGEIAIDTGSGWTFDTPADGWRAYVKAQDYAYDFVKTVWTSDPRLTAAQKTGLDAIYPVFAIQLTNSDFTSGLSSAITTGLTIPVNKQIFSYMSTDLVGTSVEIDDATLSTTQFKVKLGTTDAITGTIFVTLSKLA